MVRFKVSNHAGKSLDEPTCPLGLTGLYHILKTNESGVRQQVVEVQTNADKKPFVVKCFCITLNNITQTKNVTSYLRNSYLS